MGDKKCFLNQKLLAILHRQGGHIVIKWHTIYYILEINSKFRNMLIFKDFIKYFTSQINSLSSEERKSNMEGSICKHRG